MASCIVALAAGLLASLAAAQTEAPGAGSAPPGTGGATPSVALPPIEKAPTVWHHNGSTVYLIVNGGGREFYYETPRPGMLEAGARRGTLLFKGEVVNNSYEGTAFIFSRQCGPFPYRVSGPILDGGRRVVLTGQAPRVNLNCQVTGHLTDTLDFTLIDR